MLIKIKRNLIQIKVQLEFYHMFSGILKKWDW